jgi:hypothetical protein
LILVFSYFLQLAIFRSCSASRNFSIDIPTDKIVHIGVMFLPELG